MRDLRQPTWIYVKAGLFVLLGSLSWVLLLLDQPTLKFALLSIIAIWCFCRFYYFLFYVIEHYVDPGFRFSGILSFVYYLVRKKPKLT
jgi:hypothetical protein